MAEPTLLYTPRRNIWIRALCWAVLTANAVVGVVVARDAYRMVGVLIFGYLAAWTVAQAVRPEPVLELADEGLVWKPAPFASRFVRWGDVVNIRVGSFLGPIVRVDLVGGRPVRIHESVLPIKADELARRMEARARDAGCRPAVTTERPRSELRRRLELSLFLFLGAMGTLLGLAVLFANDVGSGDRANITVVGFGSAVACFVFARRRRRPRPRDTTFRL